MQLVIESAWTVKEINYRYIRTKHEGADGDKRLLASSMAMGLEPFSELSQLQAIPKELSQDYPANISDQ